MEVDPPDSKKIWQKVLRCRKSGRPEALLCDMYDHNRRFLLVQCDEPELNSRSGATRALFLLVRLGLEMCSVLHHHICMEELASVDSMQGAASQVSMWKSDATRKTTSPWLQQFDQ